MAAVTLFVRKIPKNTSAQELVDFINSGVSWLARLRSGFKYKIIRVKILTTVYGKTMEPDFHGLVTITPDTIVDSIIRRLRFKHLRGQRVMVRIYHERSAKNDRRNLQNAAAEENFRNLRVKDRRVHIALDFAKDKLQRSSNKSP